MKIPALDQWVQLVTSLPWMVAWSHSGNGYLHVALPVLALFTEAGPQLMLVVGLALLMERPTYWFMKNCLKRRRPQEYFHNFSSVITASDRFSFPSGHSSGAFLLATAVCIVYGGLFTPLLLWAAGVALSRVILGVHFPGDTLAGSIMGAAFACTAAAIVG